MYQFVKQTFALILMAVMLSVVSAGYASPITLPVDQITPGMRGIAKTVVSGTQIEEFGVEVLGIMKGKGPSGDLILVRTYGDVIDRTGGIAQGMSGSPVYIDGKLVGAIAYGWSLTDHKIGMVTPIGDMLKLWELPDTKNHFSNEYQTADVKAEPLPMKTPLMVAGFSDTALEMLKTKLEPFQLVPVGVGDAPAGMQFGPLEPGSAVGVQLVSGDFSMGALGTVTYTEGDKVLAFGHPFLKKGNVSYLMTNAYVFTTVNGLESSFKVGTTGEIIGLINQDRGAAVAGKVGWYPSIVPMRMTVCDNSIKHTEKTAVQIVQDEQLAPVLAAVSAFNAINKTMDRVGPGTARVSFEIAARNMPGEVLVRENMFYSPANIGELAVAEFLDAMALLSGNQFNPVDIMDVKINVGIDEERRTANIMEARSNVAKAKPGDQINILIKLKPYRGDTIERVVSYTIPKDQPSGPMTLEVRGGGMIPLTQLLLKKQGIDAEMLNGSKHKNQSFADVLKEFSQREHNNDIVVEPLNMAGEELASEKAIAVTPDKSNKTDSKDTAPDKANLKTGSLLGVGNQKVNDKAKIISTTDYIVDGDTQVVVEIEKVK